jgi:hypothetical protein
MALLRHLNFTLISLSDAQYAIFGGKFFELFAIFNYRRVGKIKFCFGQSRKKKNSVAIKQHEV